MDQLGVGSTFVQSAINAANSGSLIGSEVYRQALITDAMQDAYNTSLNDYLNHSFYSAQQHLQDMAEVARVELDTAVDTYTEATAAMETVVRINQMTTSVQTVEQAEAVQDYAQTSGASEGITDGMQNNYNTAVQDVSKASQDFATYSKAAADSHLVAHMDAIAEQYDVNMADAYTAVDYVNNYITTTYVTDQQTYVTQLTHSMYFVSAYDEEQESVYAQ